MLKQAKVDVDYTPKAKNPSEQCQWCAHFYNLPRLGRSTEHAWPQAGGNEYRCTKVEGDISPQGWCKLFKADSR